MRRSPVVAVCVLVSACSSALDAHQAVWAAKGPSSYQYTHTASGFVPHVSLRVTVESRAVSSTTVIESAGIPGPFAGATIEQLFEDLQHRLDHGCRTTARYDEALGYPLAVSSDCGQEGDGWTVTDLVSGTGPGGG